MLRVGVVLDSYTSSAWVAKVIEDIQSSGFARLELVILNDPSEQGKSSLVTKLRDRWRLILFQLYERWDYKRNKADHDALAPTDVSSLLHGVPSISVPFNRKECSEGIAEQQLAEIRNYSLDVLFRFDSRAPQGGIPGTARYGLWWFHYGDIFTNRDGPPLLRELIERNPVSGSSLQIFTESLDGGRTLYESHSSTNQISLYSSRNPIYWKTAEFALRCLRELQMRGIDYVQSLPACSEQGTDTRRRDRAPNNLQMISFMGRYVSRLLQARLATLRPGSGTKWFIGIRRRTAAHRFDDTSNYRLMPCPKDRFYADPFLFEKDGKTYLFFEDFRYDEGRAVISYCELGPDGTPGSPVEVLRRPYHLSYPFVFEYEGEIYMIPETREKRMLELYRATSFPTTWIHEAVLLSDVHVVDATIQEVNGRFWMFAGVSNGRYSNSDELCLFFADALTGPWTPHRNNPVLSDVRRSRPAGLLFYDEGRLIRPSQDCGKAYGYALVFSEVLTLTETDYEERQVSRIEPGLIAGCIGTHTYNRTEQFEVVDRTLPGQ
jgi:hypothetical protein